MLHGSFKFSISLLWRTLDAVRDGPELYELDPSGGIGTSYWEIRASVGSQTGDGLTLWAGVKPALLRVT